MALSLTVLPAGGATIRTQRDAVGVSIDNASVAATERPNDSPAMTLTEDEANFGGAAYSPFVESHAKSADRDIIHASADPSANGADLRLCALALLAAAGVLIYLVRRAWSA